VLFDCLKACSLLSERRAGIIPCQNYSLIYIVFDKPEHFQVHSKLTERTLNGIGFGGIGCILDTVWFDVSAPVIALSDPVT
jgi:hypothetical protein